MPGYVTSYTPSSIVGTGAPSNAAYLTNGSVAGLSAEVDITNLTGTLTFAGASVRVDNQVLSAAGSNGVPSYAFHTSGVADADTGMYSPATGQIGFTTDGAEKFFITTTTIEVNPLTADVDFIVDGDTVADLFYIDAGLDAFGFGRTASAATLTIFDKNFTADAERSLLQFNSITHTIAGAVTTSRLVIMTGATYSAGTLQALTHGVTLDISAPTCAGAGPAIVKNPSAIRISGSSGTTYTSQDDLFYSGLRAMAYTVTLTGSADMTVQACAAAQLRVDTLTLTDTSAITVGAAAALYIAAAPVAAGSVTLNNAYSIWCNAGLARFDGSITIGSSAAETGSTNTLLIENGTAPDAGVANNVIFYSTDNTGGNTIPSFYCEGTGVIATGQADSASSVRVLMRINGTVVTLLAI